MISTHTPLAGRDSYVDNVLTMYTISTHTPLAGRDPIPIMEPFMIPSFLLTRPSRDVTVNTVESSLSAIFLLTRPSRDVT